MIIDALLALAVLAAIAGTLTKNWTAGALLASFIVSTILCRMGTEFNIVLWVGIDLMVIAFFARWHMPRADWLILALFAPVFVLYGLRAANAEPSWEPQANAVIVALQMFLTFPAEWVLPILRRWRRFNKDYDPWGDLRAYA